MDVRYSDEMQTLWILGTLPESWETLSVSVSASHEGNLTKTIVVNAILNEEDRRRTDRENHGGQNNEALVYEQKKGKNKRLHSKTKPHKDKKGDLCHYCNKTGHWKAECYEFKKDVANGTVKTKRDGNNVAVVNSSNDLLVIGEKEICFVSTNNDDWVIDSGASFHVTPHKSHFYTYKRR